MIKRELVKEVMSKYSKDELLELTNSAPRTPLKVIKKKLLRLKASELESLLSSPKLIYRLNIKALPIIALAVLIMISVLTQGFNFPQAAANTNVGESTSSTGSTSLINVIVTYLTDSSCSDCYDVSRNSLILVNYGLTLTESYVDAGSNEGQELINKYKITKYPTFILSSDAMDSESLSNVWAGVGSVESDGALVFRAPEVFATDGNYQLVLPNGTVTEVEYIPPETIIGRFLVTDDELCIEDGKPIIYFFGSNSCPYCRWEHPIVNEVALLFNDSISYHENMDSDDDESVFMQYSEIHGGGIPFVVLGCKYVRVGSGGMLALDAETISSLNETLPNNSLFIQALSMIEEAGEDEELIESASELVEHLVLRTLICELTNNQPASVCE